MSDQRIPGEFAPEVEARFRESRANALIAVNLNTFWSIAMILLSFGFWDAFVDPAHWRAAFNIRLLGAALVVATGLFQKWPGKARYMPVLAKIRLTIAVVASLVAATLLDRGYGFGVAGLCVIVLTGPYVALDSRDLLKTNLLLLSSLVAVMFAVSLDRFDMIATAVFALLAVAASSLLGRVLEASNRRAFALDLELRHEARTDALTGLDNRRAIEAHAAIDLERARRSGAPVSVILADLDHFKSINDRHGHEAGDDVLITAAKVLRGAVRATDGLGRWGGEEFIAVLANADEQMAAEIAERMRSAIAAAAFHQLPKGITISIGVATRAGFTDPAVAWDELIAEADRHLYQAKSAGRNRVVSKQG